MLPHYKKLNESGMLPLIVIVSLGVVIIAGAAVGVGANTLSGQSFINTYMLPSSLIDEASSNDGSKDSLFANLSSQHQDDELAQSSEALELQKRMQDDPNAALELSIQALQKQIQQSGNTAKIGGVTTKDTPAETFTYSVNDGVKFTYAGNGPEDTVGNAPLSVSISENEINKLLAKSISDVEQQTESYLGSVEGIKMEITKNLAELTITWESGLIIITTIVPAQNQSLMEIKEITVDGAGSLNSFVADFGYSIANKMLQETLEDSYGKNLSHIEFSQDELTVYFK